MTSLGSRVEANFRNQVASTTEWLSTQLVAMSLKLPVAPAVKKDCVKLAGVVDEIHLVLRKLIDNSPAEYASIAHKLNGMTNSVVLGIGILKHAVKTMEEREWHHQVDTSCQVLVSLIRRVLETCDPNRSTIAGVPIVG